WRATARPRGRAAFLRAVHPGFGHPGAAVYGDPVPSSIPFEPRRTTAGRLLEEFNGDDVRVTASTDIGHFTRQRTRHPSRDQHIPDGAAGRRARTGRAARRAAAGRARTPPQPAPASHRNRALRTGPAP